GAGLQLGIGGRGLNPNRTSNFNTRQNGYDISADPHGYPESYYSPPLQAVERIEVLRGAAGLQFGPQFGGMINFELREASKKKFGIISEQTLSSWNGLTSFNQFGGTFHRSSYSAFVQYKKGDGWRENSQYEAITAFAKVSKKLNEHLTLSGEYTYFHYLAKQAGGLTDTQFILNPNFSQRSRNWFRVDWNLLSASLEWSPNKKNLFQIKPFALIAQRQALGFLGLTSRTDPGDERDLIRGQFENYGVEARAKHRFEWMSMPQNLLFGARYFNGSNRSQQGVADSTSDARFNYISSDSNESSDYSFDNENLALYSELLLQPNSKWSIVPGARFEHLNTKSDGNYTEIVTDGAGNVLPTYPRTIEESDQFKRNFFLFGLGVSRKIGKNSELFANYSRNYRGINFSDVRIENPKQLVSPDIQDEKGFNADFGIKTNKRTWGFDLTAFHLKYLNKIGNKLESRTVNPILGPELFQVRQNLGDASIYGLEFLAKLNLRQIISPDSAADFKCEGFINASWITAHYDSNAEPSVQGNQVEFVPEWNIKSGFSIGYKNITIQHQFTYLSQQFTDATNAGFRRDPQGVIGEIPEYWIHDVSARIKFKKWALEGGVNNLMNQSYFTRRATGYPGPGIIPSDPRNIFITLSFHSW
ncbi:MAG: TonB-dependent receptor family protein, partial [Flavobacteriales bacterium]